MKTKKQPKKDVPEVAPEVKIESVETAGTAGTPDTGMADETGERISVAIYLDKATGKVQWDRMQKKTKEQLKDILSNPEISKLLGSPFPKEVQSIFDPSWSGGVLDALALIERIIAQKFFKVSAEAAGKAFKFSDTEKATVSPFLSNVINKYAVKYELNFLRDFKDEIGLVVILSAMTQAKIAYASKLDEQIKLESMKRVNGSEVKNVDSDTEISAPGIVQ
jgi:hypothetical protein